VDGEVRFFNYLVAPDRIEQLFLFQQPPVVFQQRTQQVKRLRRKRNRFIVIEKPPVRNIELKVVKTVNPLVLHFTSLRKKFGNNSRNIQDFRHPLTAKSVCTFNSSIALCRKRVSECRDYNRDKQQPEEFFGNARDPKWR
jgi:hypothetical protein